MFHIFFYGKETLESRRIRNIENIWKPKEIHVYRFMDTN